MSAGERDAAQIDLLIRAHRVGVVFDALPFAMLVSTVLALFLAASHWDFVERGVLFVWLVAVCLANGIRFFAATMYRRVRPLPEQSGFWSKLSLGGALIAGLVWGAGSQLMFIDESVPHQVFLAFVIAGLCAGTVATMSAQVSAVLGFMLLASLPLLYRFAGATHEFATPMAVMLALFVLMLVPASARFYRNITDMLAERYARQKAQGRESARSAVLELVANGAPLSQVLVQIAREAERERPGVMACVMLLDEDRKHLHVGAAPSLPGDFIGHIDGVPVGRGGDSCAAAASGQRRVVVQDMSAIPGGGPVPAHFEDAGLRASWSAPAFAADGSVVGVLTVYRAFPHSPDTDELEWIEEMAKLTAIAIERDRAAESLRLAALVYQNSSEAMVVTDSSGRILAVNAAFSVQTGWAGELALGRSAEELLAVGGDHEETTRSLRAAVLSEGRWQGEIECRRADASAFPAWVTIDSIGGDEGEVFRRVILLSDITEKKEADALIWSQANYDSLTGMPNRRLFSDRLHHAIRSARRDDQHVAALLIDLDRFKAVNETFGLRSGDILLVEAARRLRGCLRDADTVARIAADEFAVALGELPSVAVVNRICEQIISVFNQPFTLGGESVFVTASIGIAVYPEDADDGEALLRYADQAMNAAKQGGRNRFSFFTRSMQEVALNRAHLLRDLRQAVADRQFSLHYQPIVDLSNGSILKAEALLRWQHPLRGSVSPAEFVPLAEESGLIHDIGAWAFQEAAQQVKRWRSRHDRRFQISVNKSPLELLAASRGSIDWVAQLGEIGLSGTGIAIEITEGVLVDPASNINETLLRLRDAGIQVAIDDFGTGYSSLAYLKRFDIDYLKIDKSFVSNLESDAGDLALAEAIVVMAHKLGFKVIAEGVETEAQRDILRQIGCDFAQGFLFSRPLPAEHFEALLRTGGTKVERSLSTITGRRSRATSA